MSQFDPAVKLLLEKEGGLVDNPHDSGGITNFGVSYRFYKSIFPDATFDDIRNLTVENAKTIYRSKFWEGTGFALLESQVIANSVFDCAVNCGISPAIKMLQSAFNEMTQDVAIHLVEDGILGSISLYNMNRCSQSVLQLSMRLERKKYYTAIVARNPSQSIFLKGWLNRANKL